MSQRLKLQALKDHVSDHTMPICPIHYVISLSITNTMAFAPEDWMGIYVPWIT